MLLILCIDYEKLANMQHKIIHSSKLLNKHGQLIQKGYATSPILKFNRKDTAHKLRLKEWDYYLIYNNKYAIAMTIGKSASILLISASVIDLESKKETTKSIIRIVSQNKLSMPTSSESGNIVYSDCYVNISFLLEEGSRNLTLHMKNFDKGSDLNVSFQLFQEPIDSMVIATPFKEAATDFYYNRKIIGMRAIGNVNYNNKSISFSSDNSFGLLDWGRGVWPYKTTWYWSAGQGMVNCNLFGFNLGYGFGDTSAATENMLFFNGVASKLNDVTFHIPINDKKKYEYMEPWVFTSSDHRFEMVFTPIFDRSANLSALILSTDQNQVFGKFNGKAVLDDGTILLVHDFLGFAERVDNRW